MKTPQTRREREIWQVCDELVLEGTLGHKVTGEAIRERLLELGYSKGSPNEIYKYRKNWREGRGIVEEDFSQPIKAVTLTDPIARAVEAVRQEIRKEAESEIEQIRKETQEQTQRLQVQAQETDRELKQLLETYQSLSSVNAELQAENRQLQRLLSDEKQLKSALEQQVKSKDESLNQLESETAKVLKELKNNHIEIKEQFNKQLLNTELHYQKEIDDLKSLHENQRHQWLMDNDRLKVSNQEYDVKLGKIESKLENENQKNQELLINLKTLESKIEDLKLERRNQQNTIKALENKLAVVETELKDSKHQYETMHGLHLELQYGLQSKLQIIGQLEERNRQLQMIIKEKSTAGSKVRHVES